MYVCMYVCVYIYIYISSDKFEISWRRDAESCTQCSSMLLHTQHAMLTYAAAYAAYVSCTQSS